MYKNCKFDIKRNCAGYYTITLGEFEYTVSFQKYLGSNGWIAASSWDKFLYSDLISTYKEAKMIAFENLIIFNEGNRY